jgi:hypothetical protein
MQSKLPHSSCIEHISSTMSAEDILAEYAVRKERESFLKRKGGWHKKTEMLRRVWPFCDIETKIIDRATGLCYAYQTTENLPSISYLVGLP